MNKNNKITYIFDPYNITEYSHYDIYQMLVLGKLKTSIFLPSPDLIDIARDFGYKVKLRLFKNREIFIDFQDLTLKQLRPEHRISFLWNSGHFNYGLKKIRSAYEKS